MPVNAANGKETAMADKYEEMARQIRADGVDEEMIEGFIAEERAEDEFRRERGTTDIEAARLWKNMPESIRQLLLGNTFCPNCGVTPFASDHSLRMRDGFVLIEGVCIRLRRRDHQALRLGLELSRQNQFPHLVKLLLHALRVRLAHLNIHAVFVTVSLLEADGLFMSSRR